MASLRFSRLFNRDQLPKRSGRTGGRRKFGRSLAFLQLEDRLLLAGLLGTAEGFAILAGSTVTNTGPSIITGNVGVSPGTAVVGFPPGTVVTGTIHAADPVAAQAQSDVTVAYNDLAGRASNFNLTGQDLGGLTLTPGVYTFASSAQLTGTLTLDAQGDPNAEFVFQIGSTLTTASNSFVILINGADSCNVFYQVGSSATLGTNTTFEGNILALASVTLNTGASILNGRALAQTGAVTLDSNAVSVDGCGSISWEKRASDGNPVLLGGATFVISPNPLTGIGTLTVVDGGANDADGLANGVLQVEDVLMGTYTITETIAPPGYAIDDDPTRIVTVSGDDYHAVVGIQGVDDIGNTDESDFHNSLLTGSISWEKRATDANPVLLGGATFVISPSPLTGTGTLTVVDGGINDADGLANGVLQVNNVLLGTYTITETVAPAGYAIDDDATRTITVSALDLNAVVGTQGTNQPGDTDESDFHNRLGSVSWEKRATDGNPVLLGGATFVISPDPLTGAGTLTVVDGGANDADGLANGVLQVVNVLLGTYTVTETVAPAGYAIDDDPNRTIAVSSADLNAVIGVQGTNQPGDTDESDFHNRLGSIAWEKRATDGNPVLLGGATFVISPNPLTGVVTLTVVDGGVNDADGVANGVLQVNNVLLGTYTITETVAPAGYAIDDDPTRSITVSDLDLDAVVGIQGTNQPGDTDESDFHNQLGSIAWEKRATDANPVLLGGATFVISPSPLTGSGTLTVVDGGVNDADGLANGVLQINNVLLGTYTITETIAPPGYAIDDDPTRTITVSAVDLNAVIGIQGSDQLGNTDESDFHNRLGSIAWEKRATEGNPVLLGGATFVVSPNPLTGSGTLTVVDGGVNDSDGLANGVLQVNSVLLGTYTITETVSPAGYAIDDDPTRSVTVSTVDLNAVIGIQGSNQPGNTDESDFHNIQNAASISWEKRATEANPLLLGGATFQITPNPVTGIGTLTVVDGGLNDADGVANGTIRVNNALYGTYTVTETVPPTGYLVDDDATRVVTVSVVDPDAVIGIQGSNQPGNTDESDFHNISLAGLSLFVIGAAKSPSTPQLVQVIDRATGVVVTQFAPYGPTFQGGIRVATGDLTGDGVDEIVTAPGWSIVAEVRVYTLAGILLTSFLPYGPAFDGGVQIAVADVDGDGLNDIITIPTLGRAEVKVFRNVLAAGVPTFDALNPYRNFLAFPASFIGGGVVAGDDMGSTAATNAPFNTTAFDQRAEIVVGSGAGITTTVKVFDVSHMPASTPNTVPAAVGSFTPFSTSSTNYKGGESLSVARINSDAIPDILVGAGANGRSMVSVWAWNLSTSATLSSLSATGFAAYTDASRNAPVEVTTLDTNSDDIADAILTVQGPGGMTNQIRQFDIISASPLQVAPGTVVPGNYPGPYYIDTVANPAPLVAAVRPPVLLGDYNLNGVVDSADFVMWRRTAGQTVPQYTGADGDGSGVIDLGDTDVWRSHFGQTLPLGSGSGNAEGAIRSTVQVTPPSLSLSKSTISAPKPSVQPYDWNLFSARDVPRKRRTSAAPLHESSATRASSRSQDDLLLSNRNLTTARLGEDAFADIAAHRTEPGQTDRPLAVTDLAFDCFISGRHIHDFTFASV